MVPAGIACYVMTTSMLVRDDNVDDIFSLTHLSDEVQLPAADATHGMQPVGGKTPALQVRLAGGEGNAERQTG